MSETSRDRIYVSKASEVQSIYERLKDDDPSAPPKRPFRYDRDTFLAAAALGFVTKNFVKLDTSDRKDRFLWPTLVSDDHALPMLRTLAILHTEDPEILLNDDGVASIAEGYANGGIRLLAKKLDSAEAGIDEENDGQRFVAQFRANFQRLFDRRSSVLAVVNQKTTGHRYEEPPNVA